MYSPTTCPQVPSTCGRALDLTRNDHRSTSNQHRRGAGLADMEPRQSGGNLRVRRCRHREDGLGTWQANTVDLGTLHWRMCYLRLAGAALPLGPETRGRSYRDWRTTNLVNGAPSFIHMETLENRLSGGRS